jgi:CopG family transcriptional regulator / antitoxin EndoAI
MLSKTVELAVIDVSRYFKNKGTCPMPATNKTKTLTISLPPQLARETERTAREEQCTKSDLVRDALRFYLQERRWKKMQQETAVRAEALGIHTEDDVDKLVHELRS